MLLVPARSIPLHHFQEAAGYARKVVAGEIPAGRWVKAACARFLTDYQHAQDPASRWTFDVRRAVGPIVFAGMLPHVKGPKTGEPIELLPFQKWLLANLFGFVERATGRRRFRQASVWMPKGNSKSTIAAILGLYCTFTEGEGGAEGYSAAVSREQAKIAFDIARPMVLKTPEFAKAFGIEVTAHAVAQVATMSSFKALSSATKALDGLNVHFAVLDEIGSHRNAAVRDALLTACAKRAEPLLVSISTTTDNTTGVGKAVWAYTEQVLGGAVADDGFFGVIYAATTTTIHGARRPGSRPTRVGASWSSPRHCAQ
jgi:phage terminase large subunit-like protein